jgi:hypothetical protein
MEKISFSDGLAISGLILAIVLVVLDKGGKLKGPVLLGLLAVAACMAIPMLFSIPWVGNASPALVLFLRRALMIFLLGSVWAGISDWITTSDSAENEVPVSHEKLAHITQLEAPKLPPHKTAIAPNVVFSQTHNGVGGMVMFNAGDAPIDNVSFSIMRSHAGPEHEADPSLLQKDLDSTVNVNVGTLLPQLATPIKGISASMLPYPDRPSSYQVNIFTRYEAFTEYLYVTPKEGSAMFDQSMDLSSNKTHVWIYKNAEKARRSWKNWPEWWK